MLLTISLNISIHFAVPFRILVKKTCVIIHSIHTQSVPDDYAWISCIVPKTQMSVFYSFVLTSCALSRYTHKFWIYRRHFELNSSNCFIRFVDYCYYSCYVVKRSQGEQVYRYSSNVCWQICVNISCVLCVDKLSKSVFFSKWLIKYHV